MKRIIIISGLFGLLIFGGLYSKQKIYGSKISIGNTKSAVHQLDEIKDGDLIFQSSRAGQGRAIQIATNSKYSHCGIIFKEERGFVVLEAVQPVKLTALDKWIARGEDGKYVIKRLKNANEVLTPAALAKMKAVGELFIGKNYDVTFEWSDDKIYCSELVWKIYQRAMGIEIGKPAKLGDFNLSNKIVREKLKERYGDHIPLGETVISPGAIFESKLLTLVKSNE